MTPATRFDEAIGRSMRIKQRALVMLTLAIVGGAIYAMGTAKTGGLAWREGLTVLIIFFAGVVASVAGFAFSAIAGALMVHVYTDPVEMIRVMLVCSITIQAYCVSMLLNKIRWRALAPYLAGGIPAAPLGVLLLITLPPHVYAFALGAFLVAYGLHSLIKPITIEVNGKPVLDAIVGALGGITGGAAAFPGAFPAIWCSARALSKDAQRAICQPFILIMQIWSLFCLEWVRTTGLVSLAKLWVYVPVSLVAAGLGFAVFQRLTGNQFRIVILNVLIASGLVLVCRAA